MYWPAARLEIVVFTPPGSTNPAGPVQDKTPGGGEIVSETVISPSLSPAQDSFITVSMVIVEVDKSFTVVVAESKQPRSSVTKTVYVPALRLFTLAVMPIEMPFWSSQLYT